MKKKLWRVDRHVQLYQSFVCIVPNAVVASTMRRVPFGLQNAASTCYGKPGRHVSQDVKDYAMEKNKCRRVVL